MLVTAAHLRTLLALTALLCAALFTACSPQPRASTAEAVEAPAPTEDDSVWRHAAAHALGDIEGAVIVMDVQTGRLRAVVNPRLAFEQAFPPGSAIKPFTALAALRGGVATRETRTQCGQQYRREGFEITCSHPPFNRPLTLAEALAHSCNFHFARLGERLSASAFNSTLAAFGFGEHTGVNAAREAAGEFRLHELQPRDALGEGERLLVTPLQLITAYAALVNGGHLYRPRLAPADNFAPQEVRSIGIAPAHRAALVEGMRGAVRSGTASRAGFDKLSSDGLDGFDIIGKTGTSTSSNGFRTQGWFVGFAAERGQRADAPAAIKVAVLVFAKRAHGSECAAVARRVIECGVRNAECGVNPKKVGGKQSQISNLRFEISSAERVRLRLTRERRTLTLALEDYLRGVLAGEASVESEAEALKAQAVVSRTFALRNLGRHAKEGYDFCDLTHCQHFKPLAAGNQGAINRAAAATEGRTLVDERGRLADVYFHASCGGRTTSIDDLWGVPSPSYLRGVGDEACAAMPHRRWRRAIPAAELAAALAGDERSNVGARLEQIVVTRRDASGRAARLTLEGARRRTLGGWDFALIVNRRLGWNTLRSAKFDVRRDGDSFVFQGAGLGHGLGLCQEGAHVLARRGASFTRILTHYFPGARVGQLAASAAAQSQISNLKFEIGNEPFSSLYALNPAAPAQPRATLSSEHFRVSFPATLNRREVEAALHTLEAAHADLARRFDAASIKLSAAAPIHVVFHATTGDFVGATGQPPWAAGATRGRRVDLQPLAALKRRGALTTTLRHELAHAALEAVGKGRAPRWLVEGLAIHFAGEAAALARHAPRAKLSVQEIERGLQNPASAEEMRALYAAAYREVQALMRAEGEAGAWRKASR